MDHHGRPEARLNKDGSVEIQLIVGPPRWRSSFYNNSTTGKALNPGGVGITGSRVV
jgi:hypothetical protein